MKSFIAILSLFSLFLLYQNCAGPIRDINDQASTDVCLESPQMAGLSSQKISQLEYEVSLSVPSGQIDRVDWLLDSSSAGSSFSNTKIFNLPQAGQYEVRAIAYKNDCEESQFFAEAIIDATDENTNCSDISITTNSQSMALGTTKQISINNTSLIQISSIEWLVNGTATNQGQANFNFSPNVTGDYSIQARAQSNQNGCGTRSSNTLNISVDDQPSINTSAQLVLSPSDGICNVVQNETALCTDPNIIRVEVKNIQNLAPSHKIKIHSKGIQQGAEYFTKVHGCFTSTTTIPFAWMGLYPRSIEVFVDTSGSCQEYDSVEEMMQNLVPLHLAQEIKTMCGMNKYVEGSVCINVGNGFYSPAKNNNRNACNTKPNNSAYTGPGANGTNNCPWTCNSGFVKSGNTCVEATTGTWTTIFTERCSDLGGPCIPTDPSFCTGSCNIGSPNITRSSRINSFECSCQ